jgi:hypothetical protein
MIRQTALEDLPVITRTPFWALYFEGGRHLVASLAFASGQFNLTATKESVIKSV